MERYPDANKDDMDRTELLRLALFVAIVTNKKLAYNLDKTDALVNDILGGDYPLNFDETFLKSMDIGKFIQLLSGKKAAILEVATFLSDGEYSDPASHKRLMNLLLEKIKP